MIPNEYLYYFYFQREALEAMRSGQVRASYLQAQQASFYDGDGTPSEVLAQWQTDAQRA